jgi:carboxypeptidase C (cathepsin A)
MVVDGTEYGEVRQYGKFSFARIYESGHEIPYYQRELFEDPCSNYANHVPNSRRCFGLLQPYAISL